MWIRTQSKDEMFDVIGISASRLVIENRFVIYGILPEHDKKVVLGEYSSYDNMISEINNIYDIMANSEVRIYQIK